MKKRKIPQPNYVRKLHFLYCLGAIPRDIGLHMINVYHDSWCGIFKNQRCDCNPDIKWKSTLPGAMN